MREGAAYVGVSVQKAGIDGGGLVPGMPLKQANADRYESLDHPGDAYAYDIYTQVGRALGRLHRGMPKKATVSLGPGLDRQKCRLLSSVELCSYAQPNGREAHKSGART